MALPKINISQFQTAKFKVHNPSNLKKHRLLESIKLISEEYTLLLDILSQDIDAVEKAASREFINKRGEIKKTYSDIDLGKYIRTIINSNAEKFKCKNALSDTLIVDVTESILSYLNLMAGGKQDDTSFPSGKEDIPEEQIDNLLKEVLSVCSLEKENELKARLKRRERRYQRPISFVRYRDAALVRTQDGKKIYAIVNIQRGEKKTIFPKGLTQIQEGKPYQSKSSYAKILLQLEMSRWQMYKFFKFGEPKTSKLYYEKNSDTFYLNYTFKFVAPEIEPQSFMGIDRGRIIVGAYGIVDFNNKVISIGTATGQRLKDQLNKLDQIIRKMQKKSAKDIPYNKWRWLVNNEMHNIANEFVRMALQYESVIVFENLSNLTRTQKRRKGTPRNPLNKLMKTSQYSNLKRLVEYKANMVGLPVVEINPAYTSQTCHRCGVVNSDFRLNQESFLCNCGNKMNADLNASLVIAMKANWIYNFNGRNGQYKNTGQFISEYWNTRISA